MIREIFITVTMGMAAASGLEAQKTDAKRDLPDRVGAYSVTERLDYAGEALFDYINGGAELYMSYGLAGMTGCKYNAPDEPQITVEIYEMTTSENAFGVYTQSREREERDFGQGSQRFSDYILFWKDRYFVLIMAQKATPESSRVLDSLAAAVDTAIRATGSRPDVVDHLPPKGLVAGGTLYFHHYIWLNAYLFIADYNILNINEHTDAVLAKYYEGADRCYLLKVKYPDAAEAQQALQQLTAEFAPERPSGDRRALRLEDGRWYRAWQTGQILYAIFDGSSEEQIEELFQSIN